jgi:hypothetical protein
MRLATYRVPRAPGDRQDAELSVVQAGGSLDANIRRWQRQFQLAPGTSGQRRQLTVNDLVVDVVELRGTYLGSRKPGAPVTRPRPGWIMVVAVVPTAGGATFFKLLGPERTVDEARSDFDVLVGSIRPRSP